MGEALRIAEEVTSDYYKFSSEQWKRHPYDVKTKAFGGGIASTPEAFAILNKGQRVDEILWPRAKGKDFYFIFVQDDQVLSALQRDDRLSLFPLMLYVFTHELIHIVRFSRFVQRFEVGGEQREEEERRVHGITYDVLNKIPIRDLSYVLESYEDHRICKLGPDILCYQ